MKMVAFLEVQISATVYFADNDVSIILDDCNCVVGTRWPTLPEWYINLFMNPWYQESSLLARIVPLYESLIGSN